MIRALILVAVVSIPTVLLVQYHSAEATPVAASAAGPVAVQEDPPSEVPGFMRKKLEMVGHIVEGMTTDDFDLVIQGGRELAELAESAAWAADRDPFYRHYSSNFERSVRGLITAAESESVEKVTFAYVHVTFSCTACHQHVRNVNRVALNAH